GDSPRIFAMMRPTVETQGGRVALGVNPAGEVAGKEQRTDAGDVGLEGQRQKIELQLDVFVEGLRHTHRHSHLGRCDAGGLHRNLQPALDLANVLRVLVEARTIGGAELVAKTRKAARKRVQNAAV